MEDNNQVSNLGALEAAALGLRRLVEVAANVLLPLLVEVVVRDDVVVHRHLCAVKTVM